MRRVAFLGAGTVGAAAIRRLGDVPGLEVSAALVRDLGVPRDLGPRPPRLTTDPDEAIAGADVVVDVMGGVEWATALMARAAARGARLVSANKAALAERWDVWGPWSGRAGSASRPRSWRVRRWSGRSPGRCAARSPIALHALLNGTCAYLIERLEAGTDFDAALAEAQRLGYAEADPALDVDGIDAAHKLTLLARMCALPDLAWDEARRDVRGVRGLTPALVAGLAERGQRARLVASLWSDGERLARRRASRGAARRPPARAGRVRAERAALPRRRGRRGRDRGPRSRRRRHRQRRRGRRPRGRRGTCGPRAARAVAAGPERRAPRRRLRVGRDRVTGEAVTFVSTRDPGRRAVSFEEALRRGLAPDGGLYVPTRIPALAPGWSGAAGWGDVIDAVLRPWFDPAEADAWVADARSALDFPVPVHPLGADTALLEVHHGPTLAFKDVAARTMGRWLARSLRRRGETATVLVATSGDTGGAVADGFAGIEGLRVVVLYPEGRVSPVQERQLTQPRAGVMAVAVDGDFDACQRLAKEALVDPSLADLRLTSANSINVGRLLPQVTYHVWGALQWARAVASTSATCGASFRAATSATSPPPCSRPRWAPRRAASSPPTTPTTTSRASCAARWPPTTRPPPSPRCRTRWTSGRPATSSGSSRCSPTGRTPSPCAARDRRRGDARSDPALLARPRRDRLPPHRRRSRGARAAAWALQRGAHRSRAGGGHGAPREVPRGGGAALPDVAVTHPALESLPSARPDARIAAESDALRAWLRRSL
jgi:hypothetical protein